MQRNQSAFSTLLGAIIFSVILTLSVGAQVPVRPPVVPGAKPVPHPRQEPCWQVAGVSPSAIRERRSLAQQARSEVESVCANSSLSIQQMRQEIQQIHARERQQIDAIITPAQREEMRSCQESRGHVGHGGGGHVGGGGGPCGEISAGHNSHPMQEQEEDDAPPNDAAKPN
jgi:hypothetical protein